MLVTHEEKVHRRVFHGNFGRFAVAIVAVEVDKSHWDLFVGSTDGEPDDTSCSGLELQHVHVLLDATAVEPFLSEAEQRDGFEGWKLTQQQPNVDPAIQPIVSNGGHVGFDCDGRERVASVQDWASDERCR